MALCQQRPKQTARYRNSRIASGDVTFSTGPSAYLACDEKGVVIRSKRIGYGKGNERLLMNGVYKGMPMEVSRKMLLGQVYGSLNESFRGTGKHVAKGELFGWLVRGAEVGKSSSYLIRSSRILIRWETPEQ